MYIGCKTPPNRQTRHSIISVHFFFPYCSRVLCVSVFWGVCVSEWEKEKKKKKKRVSWAVWFGFNTFISKMPRPGPRPYECVRRAWHSERHQPVRGSIIQQIFRFWVLLVFPLSFFYLSPLFTSWYCTDLASIIWYFFTCAILKLKRNVPLRSNCGFQACGHTIAVLSVLDGVALIFYRNGNLFGKSQK